MNTPLDASTVMMPFTLPEDPEPGEVITLPKEQVIGGASVINLYLKSQLIGATSRVIPIPNVTRMYRAERTTCSTKLPRNALIRVKALQFCFSEVTFFQSFGWMGTKTRGEPVVLSDKFYRVLAAILVGPTGDNFYLYEQLCLKVIDPKGDQNETSNPR